MARSQALAAARELKDAHLARRAAVATPDATEGMPKQVDAPTSTKPSPPSARPTTTERLEAARAHVPPAAELRNLPPEEQQSVRNTYATEQSKMYDQVATDLEKSGGPRREDFTVNGRFLDWEYQEALRFHDDQLEEAQQGAKPERERAMRAELETTATGREMLEFERRAGVPITIKTDREWRASGHDPNTLAFSSGDDGLTFNVRHLNSHVFVHEMTHQVDHRTKILAPEGDPRSKEQVVAEATAKYEEYGLDPTEVEAVVDATYHQPDLGHSMTHAHTRLAEAKHHRVEQGGQPLTEAEMREVMALSLPREQDGYFISRWNDTKDEGGFTGAVADAKLRAHAKSRGIDIEGQTAEQIVELLQTKSNESNDAITEIELRGTTPESPASGVGGGLKELASGLGSAADASLPDDAVPMDSATSAR